MSRISGQNLKKIHIIFLELLSLLSLSYSIPVEPSSVLVSTFSNMNI